VLILDLCGGTGSWSKPYRDAGYCVEIVDRLGGRDARLLQRMRGVWGVLAAPVCTDFSYARNRYEPTEAEYLEALSLVDACIRIAWVQMQNGAKWWALENPRNKLRRYLGPARLEFYQWEYGDPGHKPTCIWGDFVPPMKQPKPRTKPSTFKSKYENARPEDAITPPNFARAFYEANP
jgi:hypothetical protein